MPAVIEAVKGFFGGKEPNRSVNPDEVVADRRGDPGRRAGRRRQGRPAPRRDAAVARHRDARRRDDQADRPQHDHPDLEVAGLLDGLGQPEPGRDPRPPGRARVRRGQQDARPVHPRRHPAGAAGHPPGRGHVRHRRERDPRRQGQGSGDRARSSRSGSPPRRCCRRTTSTRWSGTPRSTPTTTAGGARRSRPATRPSSSPTRPSGRSRTWATRSRPTIGPPPSGRSRPSARRSRAAISTRSGRSATELGRGPPARRYRRLPGVGGPAAGRFGRRCLRQRPGPVRGRRRRQRRRRGRGRGDGRGRVQGGLTARVPCDRSLAGGRLGRSARSGTERRQACDG